MTPASRQGRAEETNPPRQVSVTFDDDGIQVDAKRRVIDFGAHPLPPKLRSSTA